MLKELFQFLETQEMQQAITVFCSNQGIRWSFILEHAPHFGGLWEAVVESFKVHLRRVVSNAILTNEELATVLTQIEGCFNSRPLAALPDPDGAFEALTPRHFLTGRHLEALPDPPSFHQSCHLLK